MNFAVLQFPGSNCDQDCVHALGNVLGHSARLLWHKETSLGNTDAVIIPGGFSYGDYLRTGAIARFSPIMQAVQTFAANGGPILGAPAKPSWVAPMANRYSRASLPGTSKPSPGQHNTQEIETAPGVPGRGSGVQINSVEGVKKPGLSARHCLLPLLIERHEQEP